MWVHQSGGMEQNPRLKLLRRTLVMGYPSLRRIFTKISPSRSSCEEEVLWTRLGDSITTAPLLEICNTL